MSSQSKQTVFLIGALCAATFIAPGDWLAFAVEAERVISVQAEAPLSMALYCASELFGHEDERGIALRQLVYETPTFPSA